MRRGWVVNEKGYGGATVSIVDGEWDQARSRGVSRGVSRSLFERDGDEVVDTTVGGKADKDVEALRLASVDRVRSEMGGTSGNVADGS